MPNPSDDPRWSELIGRVEALALQADSAAWLRGDADQMVEIAPVLLPHISFAGGSARLSRRQEDRRRLEALRDRCAALTWQEWISVGLTQGAARATASFARLEALDRMEARVRGASIISAAVRDSHVPSARLPGLIALARLESSERSPEFSGIVARRFVGALSEPDRMWALIGLARILEHVPDRKAAIESLTRVCVTCASGDETFSPGMATFPSGELESARYFRLLRETAPRSFLLLVSGLLIRRLGEPLPPAAATAIAPCLADAPLPIARLAGELLAGSPSIALVRSAAISDLRSNGRNLREILSRLVTLPLSPEDPIYEICAKLAAQGDDLDRSTLESSREALRWVGSEPSAWTERFSSAARSIPSRPRSGLPLEERSDAECRSLSSRLSRHLDDLDPLEEILARERGIRREDLTPRITSLTGHVAQTKLPLAVDELRSLGREASLAQICWARLQTERGDVLAFFTDDPARVIRLLLRFQETLPPTRRGIVLCAGTMTLRHESREEVSGPAITRIQTLSGIVRPGQFLVVAPVDPAYLTARAVAYAEALTALCDGRTEVESWGQTRLPDRRECEIWCIVTPVLNVRWPATELRSS